MSKPIIKWVGGKTQLLPQILQRLPTSIKNGQDFIYAEPFMGSSAVGLHLLGNGTRPTHAVFNDINADLVNLYQVVREQPSELIEYLKTIQADYDKLITQEEKKPYYYQKREQFNQRNGSEVEQAGLFMFLNRAGFNGLYRVNRNNEFNVPIGGYKKPTFVFDSLIQEVSSLLQNADVLNGDYTETLTRVQQVNKDNLPVLFYLDPPYKPISETSSFTAYAKSDFNDSHQVELADFCQQLDKLGYHWILSNSDPKNTDKNNHFFDDLYADFTIERVPAKRSINANGNGRGQINEILVRNFK